MNSFASRVRMDTSVRIASEPSEQALVDQAQAGSVVAFEQLVLRHQDRLFGFLQARCRCRADAEDALQEAFAAAYRYLGSYQPKYRFGTWLFTIAQRKLAGLSRRPTSSVQIPTGVASDAPGPEQQGMAAQRRNNIWSQARMLLPPPQFSALWLYYVEEMTIAETAMVLHRPQTWVKVNLYRARQRLSKAPGVREQRQTAMAVQENGSGVAAIGERST